MYSATSFCPVIIYPYIMFQGVNCKTGHVHINLIWHNDSYQVTRGKNIDNVTTDKNHTCNSHITLFQYLILQCRESDLLTKCTRCYFPYQFIYLCFSLRNERPFFKCYDIIAVYFYIILYSINRFSKPLWVALVVFKTCYTGRVWTDLFQQEEIKYRLSSTNKSSYGSHRRCVFVQNFKWLITYFSNLSIISNFEPAIF